MYFSENVQIWLNKQIPEPTNLDVLKGIPENLKKIFFQSNTYKNGCIDSSTNKSAAFRRTHTSLAVLKGISTSLLYWGEYLQMWLYHIPKILAVLKQIPTNLALFKQLINNRLILFNVFWNNRITDNSSYHRLRSWRQNNTTQFLDEFWPHAYSTLSAEKQTER